MHYLEKSVYSFRKFSEKYIGFFISIFCLLLVILKPQLFFTSKPATAISFVLITILASVLGWKIMYLWKVKVEPDFKSKFELGVVLVVLTYLFIFISGGFYSPFYPLIYIVVAFAISFWDRKTGVALVIFTIIVESVIVLFLQESWNKEGFFPHIIFIIFFALLNLIFTKSEIIKLRKETEKKIIDQFQENEKISRDFRLLAAPQSGITETMDWGEEKKRLEQSCAGEIKKQIFYHINFIKKSLRLHTAALFWIDRDNKNLKLIEAASDCNEINSSPIGLRDGVVGATLQKGIPITLKNIKNDYKGIPYYPPDVEIKHFLSIPLKDMDEIQGILCLDRITDEPFETLEIESGQIAVEQIARLIQNERVFSQLERTKSEQSKLYHASKNLGNALTEDEVLQAGLNSIKLIIVYDFVVITVYNKETKMHEISKVDGNIGTDLQGLTFKSNNFLVDMALKTRHYLPYKGQYDNKQTVFDKKHKIDGVNSLLVLPLISQDDAIGTLTIATYQKNTFGDSSRHILQILANQLAVSMTNARMLKKLEELATTDGLTGLNNRRIFKEQLEQKFASAKRFGYKLSLIISDLDHFKSINDTYGHPVGDLVLKKFADILMLNKRETDLVARYGGEEFVVLCEQTDSNGALLLAERIRKQMSEEQFKIDMGTFNVTCSLGIATFPEHTQESTSLLDKADNALYSAKKKGRNQVVIAK